MHNISKLPGDSCFFFNTMLHMLKLQKFKEQSYG